MDLDITKWINLPGALIYLCIFPGLMYIWAAKGFREKRPVFSLVIDAFMVGLLLSLFTLVLWSTIGIVFHQTEKLANFFNGLIILIFNGIRVLFERSISLAFTTVYYVGVFYCLSLILGYLSRLLKEGRFPPWKKGQQPRIFADSFLDVELLRLRERRVVPQVIITLKNGEKIRGKCYSYTFTEPREMAVDSGNEARLTRHIVIVKLDENIERLELLFEEPTKKWKNPLVVTGKFISGIVRNRASP
ncbi:hypothetical protein [Neomoorella thermoacetica]|uniref:hypothetical protein n=1 Tax=Neomoorella thermoacetica TaxID=1525 RepID=UPI0008FB0F96|nr:hypothetical protein [Moorella thermoacetica]OIQ53405.1 hypothetical protein MORE_21330 [Moorella thermoacetica]